MNPPKKDPIIDEIKHVDLFRELNRRALSAILEAGTLVAMKEQTNLFHQGEPAINSYFILSGRIKLVQTNELGEEIILHYLGQHQIAAAISCVGGHYYPATARVLEAGRSLCWDHDTLSQLMLEYPTLAMKIIDILQTRFLDTQERFMERNTRRVEQRLARTLLRLLENGSRKTKTGVIIDFPLSRQDIAEHAGTTLFTASRILSSWEKEGSVQSEHKHIRILNLANLQKLASLNS